MSSDSSSNNNPSDYKANIKDVGREGRLSFRNLAEHQLRRQMKEESVETCREFVTAFGDCAKEQKLWVVFKCRDELHAMNACLEKHNNEEAWQKYKKQHEDEIQRRAVGGNK